VPDRWLRIALGLFAASIGIYSILNPRVSGTISRLWCIPAGIVGGAVATVFGAGGPLYATYLSGRLQDKSELRATVSTLISISAFIRAIVYAFSGLLLHLPVFVGTLALSPFSWAGLSIGRKIHLGALAAPDAARRGRRARLYRHEPPAAFLAPVMKSSGTPATVMLAEHGVEYTEHTFEYVEHGGRPHRRARSASPSTTSSRRSSWKPTRAILSSFSCMETARSRRRSSRVSPARSACFRASPKWRSATRDISSAARRPSARARRCRSTLERSVLDLDRVYINGGRARIPPGNEARGDRACPFAHPC
jgi:hypothetical protein